MPPYPTSEPHHVLVAKARGALAMTQKEIGRHLGVSSKTVGRWMKSGTTLAPFQARLLVNLLLPVDRELAARVAATQGETLAALLPEVPARPALDEAAVSVAVDAVVCAAAHAADVSPRVVRPALLAALRRAREAGVTVEQVEAALAAT
jgi:transcriptional regulator with XRE-family HTH domain